MDIQEHSGISTANEPFDNSNNNVNYPDAVAVKADSVSSASAAAPSNKPKIQSEQQLSNTTLNKCLLLSNIFIVRN